MHRLLCHKIWVWRTGGDTPTHLPLISDTDRQTDRQTALVLHDYATLIASLNLLPAQPMRKMPLSRTKDTQDVRNNDSRSLEHMIICHLSTHHAALIIHPTFEWHYVYSNCGYTNSYLSLSTYTLAPRPPSTGLSPGTLRPSWPCLPFLSACQDDPRQASSS